jgi:hypothetical protein
MKRFFPLVLLIGTASHLERIEGADPPDTHATRGGTLAKRTKVPHDQRSHPCDGGRVLAFNATSITVQNAQIVDGTQNPPVFTLPLLTLQVSEVLAKGNVPTTARGGETYRLTDLNVGDKVDLRYDRTNGTYTCIQISITRRPGGKVPPAQDIPTQPWAVVHHEFMNALQDLEERGIPLPEKFRPKPTPPVRPTGADTPTQDR